MGRLAFLTSALVFMSVSSAQAGFQWQPPAEAPREMPAPAAAAAPPMAYQGDMMAYPTTPVMSEPLGQTAAPTSIVPNNYYAAPYEPAPPPAPQLQAQPQANTPPPQYQPQQQMSPQPQMQAQSRPQQQQQQRFKGDGLVIDPYPLFDNRVNSAQMEMSEGSVQQAMVDESEMLQPLPLGGGMRTGAQAKRAMAPTAYGIGNMQVASNSVSVSIDSGLTPMVGGEPPPLPGIKRTRSSQAQPQMQASMQAAAPMESFDPSQSYQPVQNYEQAIGFGNDLPLALALSQVIPQGYTHSYTMGVDPGTTVDWDGGRPWNVVLNDMLRPHNMTATIQGNNVTISAL